MASISLTAPVPAFYRSIRRAALLLVITLPMITCGCSAFAQEQQTFFDAISDILVRVKLQEYVPLVAERRREREWNEENPVERQKGMAHLTKVEDDLLARAMNSPDQFGQQTAFFAIGVARYGLEHRNPIPIADLALKSPAGAFLAGQIDQVAKARRLLEGTTEAAVRDFARQLEFAEKILQEDSPSLNCPSGEVADVCLSLNYLLAMPAASIGPLFNLAGREEISREGNGTEPDRHRSNPKLGLRAVNERPFLNYIMTGEKRSLPPVAGASVIPERWKQMRLRKEIASTLASPWQSKDLTREERAIFLRTIWSEPALRRLLHPYQASEDSRTRERPSRSLPPVQYETDVEGRADSRDEAIEDENLPYLKIEEKYVVDARRFLVLKLEDGMTARWVVLELPKPGSQEIWYWTGEQGPGASSMFRTSLTTPREDVIIIRASETTSALMTIWIVNPRRRGSVRIFGQDEARHGDFFLADFDGDGNKEIFASIGTGDQRYEKCNQCPQRREAFIFGYEPSRGKVNLLAHHRSWGDHGARTSRNLAGLGPEVTYTGIAPEIEEGFAALEKADVNDPVRVVGIVQSLLGKIATVAQGEEHSTAARDSMRVIGTLQRLPTFPGKEEQISYAAALASEANLSLGNVDLAEDILRSNEKGSVSNAKLRSVILTQRFEVARQKGNFREQYQTLQELQSSHPDAALSMTRLAEYLLDVGSYDDASLAARKAADLRIKREESWLDDAYLEAVALVQTGSYETAVATLTIIQRAAIERRDSTLSSKVLLTATDIALRNGYIRLARHLLDSSLGLMNAEVWAAEGPAILLLYGKMLRLDGSLPAAERVLAAALHAAGTDSSLVAATAHNEIAAVHEGARREKEAAVSSWSAFNLVIGSQTQVSEERHKLSFVASSSEIADTHLARLIRGSSTKAADLVDAIESWRAQVLRNLRRSSNNPALNTPRPSAAVADFARNGVAYATYHINSEQSVAVIAVDGELETVRLQIGPSELDELRSTLQLYMNDQKSEGLSYIWQDRVPPQLKSALSKLYSHLIGNLSLPPAIKLLVVVPDEKLSWIPWPALDISGQPEASPNSNRPESDRLRSVFERMSIVVSPSGLLVEPRERSVADKGGEYLVVESASEVPAARLAEAIPDMFVSSPPRGLKKLSFAAAESADVDRLLSKKMSGKILSFSPEEGPRERASAVDQLIEAANGVQIIHISAHGVYNPNNPMASAVFLGEASAGGVVRPSDFASLDLTRVALVSLSACQTGLADVRIGGEALGFVRGILLGGARRVLLTQWNVEDRATREFFQSYYETYSDGGGFVESYRKAILESSRKYKHPYYWAGIAMYSTNTD